MLETALSGFDVSETTLANLFKCYKIKYHSVHVSKVYLMYEILMSFIDEVCVHAVCMVGCEFMM